MGNYIIVFEKNGLPNRVGKHSSQSFLSYVGRGGTFLVVAWVCS